MPGRRDRRGGSDPPDVELWYRDAVASTSVRRRWIDTGDGGDRVHLLETGSGPPLLLLHGTGVPAGLFLPLLAELDGVLALAPDRPGSGLSDPLASSPRGDDEAAVAWLDRLLDSLGLDTTALLGHSAGGTLALRYASTRPERVERLVLIGPPTLPGTRCPLPHRLLATPGLGRLLTTLPPSRASVLQFARLMGERDTLATHPKLVDMFLIVQRDPVSRSVARDEVRVLVAPHALLTRSGWRSRSRIGGDALRALRLPTLLIWGEREPLGSVENARALAEQMPDGRLHVPDGGHAPWLGKPAATAAAVLSFVLGGLSDVG
jgi:pimeloyl-ACP methyl ester carboxylesterase